MSFVKCPLKGCFYNTHLFHVSGHARSLSPGLMFCLNCWRTHRVELETLSKSIQTWCKDNDVDLDKEGIGVGGFTVNALVNKLFERSARTFADIQSCVEDWASENELPLAKASVEELTSKLQEIRDRCQEETPTEER